MFSNTAYSRKLINLCRDALCGGILVAGVGMTQTVYLLSYVSLSRYFNGLELFQDEPVAIETRDFMLH